MAYFPMFVNLTNQECLICGGGKVALRKVEVLLDFGAIVTVIAPEICPEIKNLANEVNCSEKNPHLLLMQRYPEENDLERKALLIAATNSKEVNHQLAQKAKARGIPVNAVDQTEDCTFIFPSYVKEKNLVAAFSSGGNSPVITQHLKEKEKEILTPELGEINEILGAFRPLVKEKFQTEKERKAAYVKLLRASLEDKQDINQDSIRLIMEKLAAKAGVDLF